MATGEGETHPKYSQAIVEAVMLEVAAERNPSHFTEDELIGRVGDREDGIVELTPEALRAATLLCE